MPRKPSRLPLPVAALSAALGALSGDLVAQSPAAASKLPAGASKMEYIKVESKALDEALDVGVYLPPGYADQQDYPTVFFLHGMNGNHHKWAERNTPARLDALIAQGKIPPAIVVCPDGRNSMYVNWINGKANWETFIADELVAAIDDRYSTRGEASQRGITGDSMGGYGALLIAFQRPDVFGSVSAHSAAVYPKDPEELPAWLKSRGQYWKDIYGFPVEVEFWRSKNLLHLSETMDVENLRKLAIYFDAGDQDRFGFHLSCEQLHQGLESRKVPHTWVLREGGHGKEYFNANVQHSLMFHGDFFEKAAKAKSPAGRSPESNGIH